MKKGILIGFAILLHVFAFGQEITISDEIGLKNDLAYHLLGEYNGRMLLFRDRGSSFEVHGFDENLKKIWEKEVFIGDRSQRIISVVNQDSSFSVAFLHKKNSNTYLQVHSFDPGANLSDTLVVDSFGFSFSPPDFFWEVSQDEKRLLVFFSGRPDLMQAYMIRLDTLGLQWQRLISSEDFNFDREFVQAMPDNQGTMFMILEKNNVRSRNREHFLEVLRMRSSSGPIERFVVPMDDYLTYDSRFDYDNLNQQLIGVGFWSESNYDRANGYFLVRVDPQSKDKPFIKFQPLTPTFLRAYHGKTVSMRKGITEATIQDLVLRRDGGAILIGERNRIFERWTGATNRFVYDGFGGLNIDFFYEDIFVMNINPEGTAHWSTVLPKKQYSQNDNGIYSSYLLFKTPSALRFVFNDDIRWENTVSEYVLDAYGKYDRNGVLSTEKLDLSLRFRDGPQTKSNEFVVPSERRNRLKLVRVTY